MVVDLAVLAAAHYLTFLLRFHGTPDADDLDSVTHTLPAVLMVQYACLLLCSVTELSWQYVSLLEVRRILAALALATGLLSAVAWSGGLIAENWSGIGAALPPPAAILVDLLLSAVGLIGVRVAVRIWFERVERNQRGAGRPVKVPTLLIGAGTAGAAAIKQIAAHPQLGIQPIGFLDDDPNKFSLVIHGTRVLGTVADAPRIAHLHGAEQALITIGNPSGEHLRRIVDQCRRCGIATKLIPGLRYILEGKVNLSAIREVAIEDLLPREPIDLDLDAMAAFVNGRRILVSGAGGSIGAELCRLMCRFGPACLVLVDHTENNLFHIHGELAEDPSGIDVIPCLADICDRGRMEQIFAAFRPDMVLHAAAYKHVPMIEWNPGEAIKNNVVGTQTLADIAHEYGVSEFVMISTDKAVNPTSIMGASKRIAEIYIQALSQRSPTRFVTVRFGNVLGSAGSVIPTFQEQIARGGPVTVTHPDMERYFMTIPEACQLVLQAATMGRGGEIFILDMGKAVKIIDLAHNLISLSGLHPNDVEIRFTGIRPGEKLTEELALKNERVNKTRHPKIYVGRVQSAPWAEINNAIADLRTLANCADVHMILRKLKEIVPEFEGAVAAAPPARQWVRADVEHHMPGLNGNGKVADHDAVKHAKTPLSLNGTTPAAPRHDNGVANGKLPIHYSAAPESPNQD